MKTLPKDYKPTELAQRPPLDLTEPILHDLLDQAVVNGYSTGSVGGTVRTNDEWFDYEVTFCINRRATQ